jgi:hypothetical protein
LPDAHPAFSRFMAAHPRLSRFFVALPKAASVATLELHHAHPVFSRFMAAHPRISRFLVEHPKATAVVLRVAHRIPFLDPFVPLAPHITAEFSHCARPRPRRKSKFRL